MKRYRPSLTNTQKPWPHLDIKLMEASMVECEDGGHVEYSPMVAAAPEMYEALECILNNQALGSPLALSISNLLAKARGE